MSSKDDEGVHEKIIGEILALIKKQGKVSPKDLNALLESLGNERGGETSEDIYKAAHQLFGMGVLRVVPESIPIKDKGLILSSKVVVRSPDTWNKTTIGQPPRVRSKIPRLLKQKIEANVAP